MAEKEHSLIVLAGPTAVGKTALSISLAREIGGEIISADSCQVYRGLDIGSAKISEKEMGGIPHYLIDVLDPTENFDVVRFQELGKAAMERICSHGHIPIVVGGTGFYIQALVYDIDFTENDGDRSYRRELEELGEKSPEKLHQMLLERDPESAEMIHENNIKRTIRALEFYHQTGKKISEHNKEERGKESPYRFAYFVLNDERSYVYDRIDRRVDLMLNAGLLCEVRGLRDQGLSPELCSMQGLGYREMMQYLEGDFPLEEAVRLMKRNTRHFAKRQITWFKREKDVIWLNRQDYGRDDRRILDAMKEILRERGILA